MGFWSAMVVITMVVAITIVMLARYGVIRSGRKGGPLIDQDNAEVIALRAELGLFKDRLAVLERIATENDRGVMLDREIEKLRSLPVN